MLTLLLTVSSSFAATLDVCALNCTYSTIQSAVDASVSGDEIVVQDDGVYAPFRMDNKTDLTLRSLADVRPSLSGFNIAAPQAAMGFIADSTGIVIEGFEVSGTARRGFTVARSTVAFDDMVIRDAAVRYSGGGMELVSSTITITDSLFENNSTTAEGFGGHITAYGNTALTTVNTDFVDGTSEQGGAIFVFTGSLTMTGGTLSGNRTLIGGENTGGAIRATNATVTLTSLAMLDNVADEEGGDLHAVGGVILIEDCDLDGGQASTGGSVYLSGLTATILDSELYGGSASGQGGLLAASVSLLTVSETEIYDGSSSQGGCVSLTGTSASFTNVMMDDCIAVAVDDDASDEGRRTDTGNGGLISAAGSNITISGGSYSNGAAEFHGGAVFAQSNRVDMTDANVDDNEAAGKGGAMYLMDSVSGIMTGNTFSGNTAQTGGALHLTGTGTFDFQGTDFVDNAAVVTGGALYLGRLEGATLTDSSFVGNTAAVAGAMYLGTANTFSSTRTHWCDNLSTTSGGAVEVDGLGQTASFASDEWVQNISGRGGALSVSNVTGNVRVHNNTFFANDAETGAAISAVSSKVELNNSIVADSIGGVAFETAGNTVAAFDYNDWWNNVDGDVGGLLAPSDLDATNVFVDPGFQDPLADGECEDNLWVAVDSATLDAGSPNQSDPDDSTPSLQMPSDIGAYGGPDADPDAWVDDDNDGFPVMWDCDDDDASTYFGAVEVCDGLDNDCDGLIDNDAVGGTAYYTDSDGDEFGDDESMQLTCDEVPADAVLAGGDCDDDDDAINPDASEFCDDIDNDCNDAIDDDAEDATDYYFDGDGDEFGNNLDVLRTCGEPLEDYVLVGDDCDDEDDTIYPFAPELCDGGSNDCDAEVDEDPVDGRDFFVDTDGDGFGGPDTVSLCEEPANVALDGSDCDDSTSDVNPDADEVCNGIDDNCDEQVDPPGSAGEFLAYPDVDGDEFGADDQGVLVCELGDAQVLVDGDCDDLEGTVYLGADEFCDGLDNDCDGEVDNDVLGLATWYADRDTDGFGDAEESLESCSQPDGFVSNSNDCDDSETSVSPNGNEVCNGIDDDCDERVDIDASDAITVYPDVDGDGQGDFNSTGEETCSPGQDPVLTARDCDDEEGTVFVGADELCDGLDNDCNDRIDDGVEFQQWYVDGDQDGYGGETTGPPDCSPPVEGAVTLPGDCDDSDPNAFPGADEVPQDGIDQDCDGLDDLPEPENTRDFEPGEDPDTGETVAAGCDCDASSTPNPAWALALVGLLFVRRRRDA